MKTLLRLRKAEQKEEIRLVNHVLCMNQYVQWLLVFIGIPAVLLAVIGMCASSLFVLYSLLGIL